MSTINYCAECRHDHHKPRVVDGVHVVACWCPCSRHVVDELVTSPEERLA